MLIYRHSGHALLLGIILPLLMLGLHPTAHDLTADSGTRLTTINHWVHGLALAAQPLVVLGLIGLCRYLEWTELTTGAFVLYTFSVVGTMTAALMSGFVASDVIAQMKTGDPAMVQQAQAFLGYTHAQNQAFARLSVIAAGFALLLWSIEILRSRCLSRVTGVIGVIVGPILALGVLTGQLVLNVSGILLATGIQAVWLAVVAAGLMRIGRR